jgi:outer membrane lipoprotein-sorting protein
MMNSKIIITILVLFLAMTTNAQDAKEIIRKVDEKARGKSSRAELTMKIVRPTWTREMSLKTWSKGTELALVLVMAPARDKGTATLKRKKEIWNWQPSIDRVIKLPPSMMMQSWMGSDFTNDDLVKESSIVNDYNQKILGDSTIDGRPCWKIELVPLPNAPVVWGKIYTWIDKKDYIQVRSENYDEDGQLVNTMIASGIKNMGGKVLASHMEIIPADKTKKGNRTILDYQFLQFDEVFTDDFFSEQNLKKIR